MKIALIMHELLVEGGGERQCVCLARALSEKGHQVTLYTSAYDKANCFPAICANLRVIDVGRGSFPRLRKLGFLRGYLDMVHLAKVVREEQSIWNPHHWPAQWGAVWLKSKLGGKVVWTCNDVPNFHEIARNQHPLRNMFRALVFWLYYFYDRRQNRRIDLSVFLSKWAENEFERIYPGETRVVRSGADPSSFFPGGDRIGVRKRFGFKPDDFVLLWLGIFMPHRRLQDAIEAVAILKDRGVAVKLWLAGSERSSPEYFKALRDLVDQRGLKQQVIFEGKVDDKEIRDFYCACDAFIFPNEHQTWGLAVLEAMACGCLAMVSTGAAVHEILVDHETAILFPPRNPSALAERIEEAMNNPRMRSEVAARGMKLVREQYTWSQFGLRMSEVFEELQAGKGALNEQALQSLRLSDKPEKFRGRYDPS